MARHPIGDWSPRTMDQTSAQVPTTGCPTEHRVSTSRVIPFFFMLFPSVRPEFLDVLAHAS